MKFLTRYLLIPVLLLTSGCTTHLSGGHHYRHHGHVSVDVHGHSSGAAVVGALIVGGIVGAIATDAKNKEEARQLEAQKLETQKLESQQKKVSIDGLRKAVETAKSSSANELVNGYSIDNTQQGQEQEYQEALSSKQTKVEWYQVGKDGNCYLMSVNNGVTDIVSAVPNQKCH